MRKRLRKAVPSMFQRRLLLLAACGCAVAVALISQTAWLTLGPNSANQRKRAQSLLSTVELIPTVRGNIVDSKGRILAIDKPVWAVAVNYDVISGAWAYEQGRAAAIHTAGAHWKELSPAGRKRLIQKQRKPFDDQVHLLWQKLTVLYRLNHPNFTLLDINKKKNTIVRRIQQVTSYLWNIWRQQRQQQVDRPVPLANVSKPIAEQTRPHVILKDVSPTALAKIRELIARAKTQKQYKVWSQVHLKRPMQRQYPYKSMQVTLNRSTLPLNLAHKNPANITVKGVATHIIGLIRDVWHQDMVGKGARPFHYKNNAGKQMTDLGGYLPGDKIGSFGIEAAQEEHLRGKRGRVVLHLDSGAQQRINPVAGKNVHLTLDIKLQAKVQAIMSPTIGLLKRNPWNPKSKKDPQLGQPLSGAAIVMRVKDSTVLASVSMPSMPLDMRRLHPKKIYKNPVTRRYLNRVVSAQYPPGSVVKPLILPAAITAGVFPLHGTLDCTGHLYPDNTHAFRCWIYKEYGLTHGVITGAQAIEESCDVFFYKIGRKMGIKRMVNWYTAYGFNKKPDCGLDRAISGALPSVNDKHASDPIFLGIGQGPIAVTPLQVAAAYATLARGGVYMQPTYVQDRNRLTPRQKVNLHLNPAAVKEALHGMYLVTHGAKGTGRWLHYHGHHPLFNVSGVTIYGKSGTADPGSRWIDKNMNGKIDSGEVDLHPDDHAWFATLVKPDSAAKPKFVVLAVVPYGGSGSQVSAPICNQIIHALKDSGYLK